jgi:hypothetical protein
VQLSVIGRTSNDAFVDDGNSDFLPQEHLLKERGEDGYGFE